MGLVCVLQLNFVWDFFLCLEHLTQVSSISTCGIFTEFLYCVDEVRLTSTWNHILTLKLTTFENAGTGNYYSQRTAFPTQLVPQSCTNLSTWHREDREALYVL